MHKNISLLLSLATVYCCTINGVFIDGFIATKDQLAKMEEREKYRLSIVWQQLANDTVEISQVSNLDKNHLSQADIRELTEELMPIFGLLNRDGSYAFNLKHVFIPAHFFTKIRAAYVKTHTKIPSFIKTAAYHELADAYYIPRSAYEKYDHEERQRMVQGKKQKASRKRKD